MNDIVEDTNDILQDMNDFLDNGVWTTSLKICILFCKIMNNILEDINDILQRYEHFLDGTVWTIWYLWKYEYYLATS